MAGKKKRLFTGLQPSGDLHIGNYFGALKPLLNLYEEYDGLLCAVDYHALTTVRDPEVLSANTKGIVRDYLAAGIDPQKITIFKQSDVSEHTELAWIFECLVTVPFLMQAHAYKDKVAKGLEANAGLFNYPMLMAADILLYDTDVVPVGQDQRQHVEYAREAAAKFNSAYGDTFESPQEYIQEAVAIIPGTDGQKMSKSYGNTIPLFASKDDIAKAVMSIVTDSEGGKPTHVYAIHNLIKSKTELEPLYKENTGNYKALKESLIEDLDGFVGPLRERRLLITESDVERVLVEGGKKAKEQASKKMTDVRTKLGIAF